MPLRVWQKKGESVEIIVLDASMEDGFAVREHNIQGSDGKWGNFERCLADTGQACPVCKKFGDDSYLILFLTVLVLKPWVNKRTNEKHEYSKMLLPLKRGQFKAFHKLEQIALKKHGTMRGMYLILEREDGDQSVATGVPVPLDDGSALDLYSEKDLIAEFGHKPVKGRDNKILKRENEDIEVFDYAKLFPEPSAKELRARYGIAPEPGSTEDNEDGEEFDEKDDIDTAPATTGPPRRRGALGNAAPAEDAEEAKESSPRRRGAAPTVKEEEPVRRRRRAPVESDDGEDSEAF